MIVRRHHIFTPNPRADLWTLVDAAASQPTTDDVTGTTYATIAAFNMYRGRWIGTALELAYVVLIWLLDALVAIVPMPVRVVGPLTDHRTTWRMRWLCWNFLWGMKDVSAMSPWPPLPLWLPPEVDMQLPSMEIADATDSDLVLWFTENIFQKKRYDGSVLDVGWYPHGRDGNFICLIIDAPVSEDSWMNPVETFYTRSTAEMRAWVKARHG